MPDHRPTNETARTALQFDHFYEESAPKLRRAIAANLRTTDHTVLDDAFQYAWLQFVRRTDVGIDAPGFAWLVTVAVREAWRLARVPQHVPSGSFRGDADLPTLETHERAGLHGDPEERAISRSEHIERVADLQTLTEAERRDLCLQALGFSYEEIADMTSTTYSAVNRHINKGRAKLRRAARRRAWREGASIRPDAL